MNVLFVHNEHNTCFAEHRFALYVKKILARCSEKLTVYNDDLPGDAEYDVVVIIDNGEASREPFWKNLPENSPAVYFTATRRENVHIPRLRQMACVFFRDGFPLEYVDFPKELSFVTHFPGYALHHEKRNPAKEAGIRNIAFIGENAGLYPCKQVIAVFNDLSAFELRLFVKREQIAVLKEYANDNILFEDLDQYPQLLNRIDLVITNGQPAVDALLNEIPAIIVGDYGFGGMVNMRTIQAHMKQSFSGRIGGTKGERIPVELIMTELEWAGKRLLEEPGFTAPLAAVARDSFDEAVIEKNIISHIGEMISLHHNIYRNQKNFLQMVPAIVGNVAMQKNGTTAVLRRLGSMRTIMELNEDELFFIRLINAQRSISELHALLGNAIEEADVLSFIRDLWEEKIIYFKQLN